MKYLEIFVLQFFLNQNFHHLVQVSLSLAEENRNQAVNGFTSLSDWSKVRKRRQKFRKIETSRILMSKLQYYILYGLCAA